VDTFTYLDWTSLDDGENRKGRKRKNKMHKRDKFSIAKLVHSDLYDSFQALPARRKIRPENYVITHTGPSVIPTFLPSVRVWHYNVTDPSDSYRPSLEGTSVVNAGDDTAWKRLIDRASEAWGSFSLDGLMKLYDFDILKRRRGRKHRKKKKKPIVRLPRHSSPHAPSRTNRYLTPLGYTQYILPLDKHPGPDWTIEYVTYPAKKLKTFLPAHMQGNSSSFLQDVHTPYDFHDLTISRWLGLAKDLTASKQAWKDYVKLMYVSSGAESP
jgi:endopolyphosphatase